METYEIILGVIILGVVTFLVYKNREKLKPALQKKIETNAIKVPSVRWEDKYGDIHEEDIIIKRSYAKVPVIGKMYGDWTRIYPPIDENGKVSWINTIFGGKKNLIKLTLILILVAIILYGYYEIFSQYNGLREICEPFLNLTITN